MTVPTIFVFLLICLFGFFIGVAIRVERQDRAWSQEDYQRADMYGRRADDTSEDDETRMMFMRWSTFHYESYLNNRGASIAMRLVIAALIGLEIYLLYSFIFQTNW